MFFEKFAADINKVAQGGEPSRELILEQGYYRQSPLSESEIEGFHAKISKVNYALQLSLVRIRNTI